LKSDKFKKIFFWNAKAGCTSLKKFIYETEEEKEKDPKKSIHSIIGQLNNNKYYVKMTPQNLKKYTDYEKVLIFRDPVERLYSFYKNKILDLKKDNYIKKNKSNVVSNDVTFDGFVDKLLKVPQKQYQHHLHLQTTGINREWIDKIINLKDLSDYLKKTADYAMKQENLTRGKTNITKINVDI